MGSHHKYDLSYFDTQFAEKDDPWDYRNEPSRLLRHLRTYELIRGLRFERVLELGCAAGAFTEYLSSLSGHIDAIDISPSAIEKNKTQLPLKNVSWQQMDFFGAYEKLDYSEHDLIVGMDILPYAVQETQSAFLGHLVKNSRARLLINYRVQYGVKGDSSEYAFTSKELLCLLASKGYKISRFSCTELVPFAFGRGIFKDFDSPLEQRTNYLYEKERLADCDRLLSMGAIPSDIAVLSLLTERRS